MMTSSNGNIFRVAGHLCGEFTGPLNSPHKGQWRGALMFSLICVWINGWVNNREDGDLRRYRAHCDVIVMQFAIIATHLSQWCHNLLIGFSLYFTFDGKFALFSPGFLQRDCYKVLHTALQLCCRGNSCRGMCKTCCDLMASNRNYVKAFLSNWNCKQITINGMGPWPVTSKLIDVRTASSRNNDLAHISEKELI